MDSPQHCNLAPYLQQQFDRLDDASHKLGEDNEALHDCRVAMRRTLSVLKAFADHSNPVFKTLKKLLKKILKNSGLCRDLEVFAAAEAHYSLFQHEQLNSPLFHWVRSQLAAQQTLLMQWFPDKIRQQLMPLLRHYLEQQKEIPITLNRWQTAVANSLKKLDRKTADADSATDKELHRIRLALKRLRYCNEAAPGFPGALDGKQLKALQDALGEWNDQRIQLTLIKEGLDQEKQITDLIPALSEQLTERRHQAILALKHYLNSVSYNRYGKSTR